MPKDSTKAETIKRSFQVRGITKEFYEPIEGDLITPQFHIELGEKNQTFIVEDRPTDWCELANKDLDKVGLANILALATKGFVDPSKLMFVDDQATDLSDLDPMDINRNQQILASKEDTQKKLQATADALGVTVDDLVDSVLKGNIQDLISSKLKEKAEESEVKE